MSLHFCKLHSPGWLLAGCCCTKMLSAGSSQLPIIHFLMEFRLRPVAGLGEDWVSLVIPHRQGAELQTYLLQGLTPGDTATGPPVQCSVRIYCSIRFILRITVTPDSDSPPPAHRVCTLLLRDQLRGAAADPHAARDLALLGHVAVPHVEPLDPGPAPRHAGQPAQDPGHGRARRHPATPHQQQG